MTTRDAEQLFVHTDEIAPSKTLYGHTHWRTLLMSKNMVQVNTAVYCEHVSDGKLKSLPCNYRASIWYLTLAQGSFNLSFLVVQYPFFASY